MCVVVHPGVEATTVPGFWYCKASHKLLVLWFPCPRKIPRSCFAPVKRTLRNQRPCAECPSCTKHKGTCREVRASQDEGNKQSKRYLCMYIYIYIYMYRCFPTGFLS